MSKKSLEILVKDFSKKIEDLKKDIIIKIPYKNQF